MAEVSALPAEASAEEGLPSSLPAAVRTASKEGGRVRLHVAGIYRDVLDPLRRATFHQVLGQCGFALTAWAVDVEQHTIGLVAAEQLLETGRLPVRGLQRTVAGRSRAIRRWMA